MYGIDTLKEKTEIDKNEIQCPVKGCKKTVPRKSKGDDLTKEQISCQEHKIEIHPSTFIYLKKEDNLLWTEKDDLSLLSAIEYDKRESRMKNDNSEDAVTWNVFRYLDRNTLVPELVKLITGQYENVEDLIYWSYSTKEHGQWSLLQKAQGVFGEQENRGSEPDMAIETDKSILLIEAKFNSGNSTQPSNPKDSLPKYEKADNYWSKKVFKESLEKVALKRKRYELMRFWLLGSWMANQRGKYFYLVNLVKKRSRTNVEKNFKPSVKGTFEGSNKSLLKQISWEDIYFMLEQIESNDEGLRHYFQNKISGFSASGKAKKAFNV